MKHTTAIYHTRQCIVILLASISLLSLPRYSTATRTTLPTSVELPSGRLAVATCLADRSTAVAPQTTFEPFLNLVPTADGTSILVGAGGIGELEGTVFANIGIGPGGHKGGWTMTYSNTLQQYVRNVPGFTSGIDMTGTLDITTTLGWRTGIVNFNRVYLPASTSDPTQSIGSVDGQLQFSVAKGTFTGDTYAAVVPSFAPPGVPPIGHSIIGCVYSARDSGAQATTNKPMILRMAYNSQTLAGADPRTLAIFLWDPNAHAWIALGGRLFAEQGYVSVATSRFGTYALMATPAWRDGFDDMTGLDLAQTQNVEIISQAISRHLTLASTPGAGVAISRPIAATTTITHWGSLTFSSTVSAPSTTLTVDVLSADGAVLLANAASGASLAAIDPIRYPVLRLRASLASNAANQTPVLDEWRLTWQARAEERRAYLPVILR